MNSLPNVTWSGNDDSLRRQRKSRFVRRVQSPPLNTLDQALEFAHLFSEEIKRDSKSRRIYRSFAALTSSQFEALLAFSIWKVKSLASSQP